MSNWLVRHQRFVNISAGAAALVVVIRTALLSVPEPLPWMAEWGALLYDLCLAWATAWAFQFLVIVAPLERQRAEFEKLIAPRVDRLIALGMELNDAVRLEAEVPSPGDFDLDAAVVSKVCTEVYLESEVPGWDGTWERVLRHLDQNAQRVRSNLRPFYSQLTPVLLEALEEEESSMETIRREISLIKTFRSDDLKRLDSPVFKWLTSISMLRTIRSTSLAPNVPMPKRSALNSGRILVPFDDFISQYDEFMKSVHDDG